MKIKLNQNIYTVRNTLKENNKNNRTEITVPFL